MIHERCTNHGLKTGPQALNGVQARRSTLLGACVQVTVENLLLVVSSSVVVMGCVVSQAGVDLPEIPRHAVARALQVLLLA